MKIIRRKFNFLPFYTNLFTKYLKETQNGKIFFDVGIILLPTAFSLSALFLIFALIIGIKNSSKSYFQDKWNLPFFVSSIFLIFNCLLVTIANSGLSIGELKTFIPWIGLTNWLPFFVCFWGLQDYLSTPALRKNCAKLLIIGSVPVFLSGFTQLWLNWSGPWEILNGIIVWYQRPVTQNFGSLSGLFNNPNYAGAWLNVIWPFCVSTIFQKSFNKQSKFIALVIAICFGLAIFLTSSRNAWLGFCLSSYLMIIGLQNLNFLKWIIPLIFTSIFVIIFQSTINNQFSFIEKIIPNFLYKEIDPSNYANWDMSRIDIWGRAIEFIIQRPIIGWGSGAFSILLFYNYKIYKGHAHNLILELAVSYGIIVTSIIVFTIAILLIKSSKKMLIKKIKLFDKNYNLNIFERAWWVSTFTLLFSQMLDVQYFDGRISIILWIFLTGLKSSIISEVQKSNNK